jgi:hypothetical protein
MTTENDYSEHAPELLAERATAIQSLLGQLGGDFTLLGTHLSMAAYCVERSTRAAKDARAEAGDWLEAKVALEKAFPGRMIYWSNFVESITALAADRDDAVLRFQRTRCLVQVALGENPGNSILALVADLQKQLEEARAQLVPRPMGHDLFPVASRELTEEQRAAELDCLQHSAETYQKEAEQQQVPGPGRRWVTGAPGSSEFGHWEDE